MILEKSAGVIVFRRQPRDGLQYLLLYHRGDYWNFPKGKIDDRESELSAAQRELWEETGLKNLKIINGWRQQTSFFFKENRGGKKELIKKDFILYLAAAPAGATVKISSEHNGFAWFDFKTAGKHLRFKNLKEILGEAHSFVQTKLTAAANNKYHNLNYHNKNERR